MHRYLLAELARKVAATATFEEFQAVDACDWLLWDTSVWRPAKNRSERTTSQGGGGNDTTAPLLVLSLVMPEGKTQCVLGRSVKCDLSLNESTLSGRHLAFSRSANGMWQVEDLGSSNGSTFEGKPLFPPGQPWLLKDGTYLTAGDVHLTFRTARGMYRTLKGDHR